MLFLQKVFGSRTREVKSFAPLVLALNGLALVSLALYFLFGERRVAT